MTFNLKRYEVVVTGYGAANFYAKDKNQALAISFFALRDAGYKISYKAYLRKITSINEVPAREGFGRKILVEGKPAHWIERGGNRVKFTRPYDDTILTAHKSDVEELPSTPPVEEARRD